MYMHTVHLCTYTYAFNMYVYTPNSVHAFVIFTRECTRGGFCNFMHLKPISRDLK